jgi:uncharacterized membrane protein
VNILKALNVLILCAMSLKRWQQILLFLIWRLMGVDHGLVAEENGGIDHKYGTKARESIGWVPGAQVPNS